MKNFKLLLMFCGLFTLLSCSDDDVDKLEMKKESVTPNEYGLLTDSLTVFNESVQKNETISDILNPHNIPLQEIYKLVEVSDSIFDFTTIKFGNEYAIYSEYDSLETVHYFVYQLDPINYIVCDFVDSISVYRGNKYVSTRIRQISGVIKNSLYMTLKEAEASDLLALKMADVFAWQIDFYSVQKDDYFKVIFEENYIDTQFVGVGKINTALFSHRDKSFYAFRFEQNGKDEYFDEEGNSLRKAFLKAPLKFSRISSRYTNSRYHPILKYYRPHKGIDYAAPTGTPVQSVGDGVVTDVRWTKQGGRFVKIKHNSAHSSGYMHLSKYAKDLKPGKTVSQGDIIGFVGSSGLATGPHLDFRFWKNGELVNYLNQEFPSSHPVKDNDTLLFVALKDSLKPVLDGISVALPDSQIVSR